MKDKRLEALDWQAFCYVAGDLPPEEENAFETRLANDQAAREAVARAVTLTCAVAAAGPQTRQETAGSSTAGKWRRPGTVSALIWATVAAAACLAGIWVHRTFRNPTARLETTQEIAHQGDGSFSAGERQQLALLWSRIRDELSLMPLDDLADDDTDGGASFQELPPFASEDSNEQNLPTVEDPLFLNDPPSWMLAAVQAKFSATGHEEDGPPNLEEN